MMEEFNSKIISCGTNSNNSNSPADADAEAAKDVLFNRTTTIIQQEKQIEPLQVQKQSQDNKFIQKLNNPNISCFPKFYMKELRRSRKIVWAWAIITLICTVLSTIALIAILKDPNCNNWVALTLIPCEVICIALLVLYANKFVQFKNEAKTIDFSIQKPITINIQNLYKRLKTAHINLNWFCSLAYILSLIGIGGTFVGAGFTTWIKHLSIKWGDISVASWAGHAPANGWVFIICLIAFIAMFFTSFILHIVLLVTNHARAGQIDSYYGIAVVDDEKIMAAKKAKNKRDAIIFMAIILLIILIGLLIYKSVKKKKQTNNITINNI